MKTLPKTLSAALLRPGQTLLRNGRRLRILCIEADRLKSGLSVKLRDGTRVLMAHADRCLIAL